MNSKKFYDSFHEKSKHSLKLINSSSFTYGPLLSVITDELTNEPISILDYGCGVGSLSLYFGSKGNTVVGVDISKIATALANESALNLGLSSNCKFMNMRSLKKEERFDLILCIEVIEHIQKDKELLQRLHALCKKNGKIILSTPSLNAPLYKLGLLKGFDVEVGHLRRYNIRSLVNLMYGSGFKIKRIIKKEGIFRNGLFTLKPLGKLIKFLKGPIGQAVNVIDGLIIPVFGESDLILIATKK